MKLLSSDIEKKIKEALKANKPKVVLGLCMVLGMNSASVVAAINNKAQEDVGPTHSYVAHSDIVDSNKVKAVTMAAYGEVPVQKLAAKSTVTDYVVEDNDDEVVLEEETEEETEVEINEEEEPNKVTDIEYNKLLGSRYVYILDIANNKISKEDSRPLVLDLEKKEFKKEFKKNIADDEVLVKEDEEEITLDNFDTVSLEKKIAFICEKYDLTDYEFKVVFSTLCHEAGWYYDDAFKVTTVLYNRINSKESIRYIHYLTKNVTEHGGDSLYSQVIATNYTKDGKKVQQFDGYISGVAGYDFDELLKKDNIEVKLDAFLDCLILLKLGEEYENPAFPLAPCFAKTCFWGDGKRNHFSNSIDTSDAVEGYNYPYTEYDKEFTREEVIEMAKEYIVSAKKRVK